MIKYLRVFLIILFPFSNVAFASAPLTTTVWDYGGVKYTTGQAACNHDVGKNPARFASSSYAPPMCTLYNPQGAVALVFNMDDSKVTTYICADGTPPNTSNPFNQQCGAPPDPPDPCKDKGPFVVKFAMKAGGSFPNHVGVCMVTVDEVLICRKETVSGVSTDICMLQVRRTGDLWTPTANDPKNPGTAQDTPEDKEAPKIPIPPTAAPSDKGGACPTGSVQGGTDSSGIPVCIGTGSTPPASDKTPSNTTKPPVTVTNSDGSKTTTQTSTNTNADGSTTTTNTVTTVAPDGTVTKTGDTTVSKTPSGAQGSTDKDSSDFCKANPTLSICRNSSVTGTCEATACEGDAIQCATLRAAATLQCRDKEDREGLAKVPYLASGQSIVEGADPMKGEIDAAVKGTSVDLGSGSLDQSGFLGNGSCLPNRTISILGKSIPLDFGYLCALIQPLRYVFLMIGFIISYLIVSKSVLKG